MPDLINHPPHYTSHPSGVECIQITEHMGFNLGNALKYIWRADEKGAALDDLRKAAWYVQREIKKRLRAMGGEYIAPSEDDLDPDQRALLRRISVPKPVAHSHKIEQMCIPACPAWGGGVHKDHCLIDHDPLTSACVTQ